MVSPIAFVATFLGGSLLIPSIRRATEQQSNQILPNELPQPQDLVDFKHKNIISEDQYKRLMSLHGYTENWSNAILDSSNQEIPVADLITSFRRGEITDEQLKLQASKLRFSEFNVERLKSLTELRPNVQDLIRFAVREVFTPELRQKFEYDAEFPEEVLKHTREIGLRDADVRNYWAAHWELPSIGQTVEMFHRLNPEWEKEHPTTVEDFDNLMKAQDVSLFWRPRLRKILYALPTRVDVRAMLQDGLITEDRALRFYKELGYDGENAKLLTQLAKSRSLEGERSLSKAMIEQALENQEIKREDAVNLLVGLNYSPDDSELIVRLKEHSIQEKLTKDSVNTYVQLYIKGAIGEDVLNDALDSLNLDANRKARTILDAQTQKQARFKPPSVADTQALYRNKIIDEPTAKSFLFENGVRDSDLVLYIKMWNKKTVAQ